MAQHRCNCGSSTSPAVTVRVDGSRRITLRNRKFLKPINSVCSNQKRWIDLVPSIESENNVPQQQPEQCSTIEEPNRTSSDPITPHLQLKTFQTTSPSPPASPLSTLQIQKPATAASKPHCTTLQLSKQPLPTTVPLSSPLNRLKPSASQMYKNIHCQPSQGSDSPNWRLPESSSRPRRQRQQRLVYDAASGSYRKPCN